MRGISTLLLGVLLVAGCARTNPPAPAVGGPAALQPSSVVGQDQIEGEASCPSFQGQSVHQWEARLQSAVPATQQEASLALREMGEAGYRPLLKAMQSNYVELRSTGLLAMPRAVMVAHKSEILPVLRKLLSDDNVSIRQSAVARFAWFGVDAAGDLPTLRQLAARDASAAVRNTAVETIKFIDIAVSIRAIRANHERSTTRVNAQGPECRPCGERRSAIRPTIVRFQRLLSSRSACVDRLRHLRAITDRAARCN